MSAPEELDKVNEAFYEKTEKAFRNLFSVAKQKNEIAFLWATMPEMRGMQDAGWSTAAESFRAFDDYMKFLNDYPNCPIKVRICLSFYCNMSEASGYYEIPKNMLRICEGENYSAWPFQSLVKRHKESGQNIAPNSNKIIADLTGHAVELGFQELAEVFRDVFDPDIRNGYAHADYVIWDKELRLPKRNGGAPRAIPWPLFNTLLFKAINFFNILSYVKNEFLEEYSEPKTIFGHLNKGEPNSKWIIHANRKTGVFSMKSTIK